MDWWLVKKCKAWLKKVSQQFAEVLLPRFYNQLGEQVPVESPIPPPKFWLGSSPELLNNITYYYAGAKLGSKYMQLPSLIFDCIVGIGNFHKVLPNTALVTQTANSKSTLGNLNLLQGTHCLSFHWYLMAVLGVFLLVYYTSFSKKEA